MACKEITLLTILFAAGGLLGAQENPGNPGGQVTNAQEPAPKTEQAEKQAPTAQQQAATQPDQPPKPADQVNLDAKLLATCKSVRLNQDAAQKELSNAMSVFDKDTRSSVRSFKKQLNDLYSICMSQSTVDLEAKNIHQVLSELNLAANLRSGTSMLNPGLGLLIEKPMEEVTKSVYADLVGQMDEIRPDKQLSAQANSSGTTSLVSKAGGAALLGLAVDSGALTQSISGTTNTLSGNLEGIGAFLVGRPPISIDPTDQSELRKVAGEVTLAATFTLAQPSTQSTSSTQPATGTSPPAGTAVTTPSSVGKLTGITAQFAVHNPFDPHSAAFRSKWNSIKDRLSTASAPLLLASSAVVDALSCQQSACQDAWVTFEEAANEGIARNNPEAIANAFDNYVSANIAAAKAADPTFDADVVTAAKATSVYQQAVQTEVDNAEGNLFTLEYDFAKPANQPETHTFKLVYGNATNGDSGITSILAAGKDAKSLFTANMGVSIYGGTIPASAKYGRLYDGQVAAEFDLPIALVSATKPSVFSLAGYWQYQPSPSVLNITQDNLAPGTTIDAPSQVLIGSAGSLWVTQAKITIGSGTSGVNIPIGVKWSNKNDLLTGKKIGGQIGISYDLSTLSSLIGGSK